MAKVYFTTHPPVLNTQLPSKLKTFLFITNIILHSFLLTLTYTIPISPTDNGIYFLSDDPNFTNLMVSHYDCEKQHILRQFNLLNVKQCTEALVTYDMLMLTLESMLEQKLNELKLTNVLLMRKKKEKSVFKVPLNIAVLIELYGIITL